MASLFILMFFRLKHDDVFPFIHKHNLFSSVDTKIESLMEFNSDKALELLINNIESVPVSRFSIMHSALSLQLRY